jgi:Glycoside-hydrolase family GH114
MCFFSPSVTLFTLLICGLIGVHATTMCAPGTVWRPTPGTAFYWDLDTDISTADIESGSWAQVYDFDMSYITQDMVDLIHSINKTLLCYIDTAYEPYRNDSYKFTPEVLGNSMDGWPGQRVR